MKKVARAGVVVVLATIAAGVLPAMSQAIIYLPGDDIGLPAPGGAGVAVDRSNGDLFVARPINGASPGLVDRFDSSGEPQGAFTSGLAAVGVAVGTPGAPDAGNVYVLDAGLFDGTPDLNTFDSTGAPVGSPVPVDLVAFNPGQSPQIAAFAAFGTPFVAYPNADDDTVELFSGGALAGPIPSGSITFVDPRAVAVDDATTFYVVDAADGGRVVKLRPFAIGDTPSVLPGSTGATSVAVNPVTGDVYVGLGSGAGFHVVVYDSTAEVIGDFGAGDFVDGNIFPRDIAVDPTTKKVYVSDSGASRIAVYEEGAPPPTVTTMSASGVGQTTATFAGTVAQSEVAPIETCRFEYTGAAEFEANGFANADQAPCTSEYPNVAASLVLATANASGLEPDTTYHFRLVASNSGGAGEGSDVVFATLPNAPTVVTGAAADVHETRARLGGSVNPNGGPVTTCEIEFGTTTAYGQTRPCEPSPGDGTSAVAVSAGVAGLSPGTTYHFRVRARNGGGLADGANGTFRTVDRPDPCAASPDSCKPTDQCVVTPAACKPATTVKAIRATVPGAAAVRAGRALIKLSCKGSAGTTCKGTLRLRARIKSGKRRARTVTIGRVRYELAAGKSQVLRVRLSRSARRSLASKGRIRARATGAGVSDRSMLLRLRPAD